MKFTELKQQIKTLVTEIKEKKQLRKTSKYGFVSGLDKLRYDVRHHHIAYCLLRGRELEEIESNCSPDNVPNDMYISKIMNSVEVREVVYEKTIHCS
ncbi:hypothetical protein KAR91_51320 [Candidatus Pacearchaeota archaeon]|nr:hypothetical protein [Candidatus Pacearchaeota archaeon]